MRAALLTMLWFADWALVAMLVSGCAVGRITPAGNVEGWAVGHAKLEYCEPAASSPKPKAIRVPAFADPTPAPKRTRTPAGICRRIQGGSLSSGVADFLGNAATAVGAYFGFGG